MNNFKFGGKSLSRRQGVDPRLIEIDDLALKISLVDFGHPRDGGVRTAERQHSLYTAGLSKCDGYKDRSKHQVAEDGYGKALDFYAFVDGRTSYDPLHLAIVGAAYLQAANMLGYRIRWGGLWARRNPQTISERVTGWDMPHIELID